MAPLNLTLAEFHDLDQMCDDKELPVAPFGANPLLTTFCLSQHNPIWATPPIPVIYIRPVPVRSALKVLTRMPP